MMYDLSSGPFSKFFALAISPLNALVDIMAAPLSFNSENISLTIASLKSFLTTFSTLRDTTASYFFSMSVLSV